MTCIITGCKARIGNATVGGDLHAIGDCFVFNAIVDTSAGAAWDYEDELYNHYRMEVDFSEARDCWERRGTIVAKASECELNLQAKEYLRG